MSFSYLIKDSSIVYVGIGCAYSRTWGENPQEYVHQQYPMWLRSNNCPKLLILIDPELENPPHIINEMGTVKEVIKRDNETTAYFMDEDLIIIAINSKETFTYKTWEGGDQTLQPQTISFYRDILDQVLETDGILINAMYSGAQEKLLVSQFPDVPKERVIWNLGYGADYSCYPPVNSLTTPFIQSVNGIPRIISPFNIPTDQLYKTWKETTFTTYRDQIAARIISHIKFVRRYAAFVDFVMRRNEQGIKLEPDQWYLCNLEPFQLNQIRVNYESSKKMDYDYAIDLIGSIYTDKYLEIFRLLPELDQNLILFSGNKRYENVSKICRVACDTLNFTISLGD